MPKIIKIIQSPYFKNETRKLIIWKPNNVNKNTPVLFFYDGQILKTKEKEFNQNNGIEIFKHIKQVGKFVIIAINSMNQNSPTKYQDRKKELLNQKDNKYLFMKIIKNEIKLLKKIYKGQWFGFGFSLSGFLISHQNKLFNWIILISPAFRKKPFKLSKNSIIFYGKKEYRFFSYWKITKPVKALKKKNKKINIIEIKKMTHTFPSWNKHFLFILERAVKPFIKISKK